MNILRIRKKVYIVYADIRFAVCKGSKMKSVQSVEEIRWQVVKAMLDDFPALRGKVKSYIDEAGN